VRVRTLRRGAGALPALSLTDLRKGFSAISTDQTSLHQHLRLQRPVDRAPLGDLKKPPALRHLQRATQLELETNTVDLPVLGLAFLAIPPIHLLGLQPESDRLQRPLLAIAYMRKVIAVHDPSAASR